jgi:BNR repeat-like domain
MTKKRPTIGEAPVEQEIGDSFVGGVLRLAGNWFSQYRPLSFPRTCLLVVAVAAFAVLATSTTLAGAAPSICRNIHSKHFGIQMNLRASEILVKCGVMEGGSPGKAEEASPALSALSFSGSDINVITGTDTYPRLTQAESFVWSNETTIVVSYNDARGDTASPPNYSGVSVSHNGGATFTRLGPSSPFTGHGANYGDPIVIYNKKLAKWFAGDLVGGCGVQGIGLWTSTNNGDTWTVGACAHTGTDDDRESMWVDNNPASPFYGRMYISYNDFSAGGALKTTHSDDGLVWSAPVTLFSSFRRNVQLTGSPAADGTVFVVGLNENGGGAYNGGQQNYSYRSTDGGVTWTSTTMGSTFTMAGSAGCDDSYFPTIPPIWRQTGYGQPAVGPNGTVHYVYAARGVDEADIYYVRSTNNGTTWSSPVRLNTDSSGRAQWMPSLRVTPSGVVEASWYDRRSTVAPSKDYQRFARVSTDNGATWGVDEPLSSVIIPQPTQPDPNIQACFAGDYNYTTANDFSGFDTWTDGRVPNIIPSTEKVFFRSVALTRLYSLRDSNSSGPADYSFDLTSQQPGDLPVSGDWNGDGVDTVGFYRPANGNFYLRNSNSSGPADIVFQFGEPGDRPVAGDWNEDGVDTIGVYRPSNGVFYLRNFNSSGPPQYAFAYGNNEDLPIAGDWNNSGTDTIGLYRPSTGVFYLSNTNATVPPDYSFAYGNPGKDDLPVAGDWDENGFYSVGVYRQSTGEWFLDNEVPGNQPISYVYSFGPLGATIPIVGDWNNSGTDTPGAVRK